MSNVEAETDEKDADADSPTARVNTENNGSDKVNNHIISLVQVSPKSSVPTSVSLTESLTPE